MWLHGVASCVAEANIDPSRQCVTMGLVTKLFATTRSARLTLSCITLFSQQARLYSAAPKVVPFLLADIGEGITEVQILQWLVKVGDHVSEFDKIANVQSDKATVEITSPYDGTIVKQYGAVGAMVHVGKPLVDIQLKDAPVSDIINNDPISDTITTAPSSPKKPLATPAVRGLAKQMNIPLDTISGSGENGRILRQDIATDAKQGSSTESRRVEMSMFQRSMVKSMEAAMKVPHFGYSERVVMDGAIHLRDMLRGQFPKLSYMPIWIKAASVALKDFPILNATLISEGKPEKYMIQYHDHHNISIAMDTAQGLAVPVIPRVDKKSIAQIAAELEILVEKGKNNALTRQDMVGGTFALSNIGSIGTGIGADPILLPPQVCIGAICKMSPELVLDQSCAKRIGSTVLLTDPNIGKISMVMTVHWSADHRLIDGATMARFSNRWKTLVENPVLLLPDLI